jgi:hypothetical protein
MNMNENKKHRATIGRVLRRNNQSMRRGVAYKYETNHRIYAMVDGHWMDATLCDVTCNVPMGETV